MITLEQALQIYKNNNLESVPELMSYSNDLENFNMSNMSNMSNEPKDGVDVVIGMLEKTDLKGALISKLGQDLRGIGEEDAADFFAGIGKLMDPLKVFFEWLAKMIFPGVKWIYMVILAIRFAKRLTDIIEKVVVRLNESSWVEPIDPIDPNAWSHSDMQEYTGSENSAPENYNSNHLDESFQDPNIQAPEDEVYTNHAEMYGDAAYENNMDHESFQDPNIQAPEDEVYTNHAEMYGDAAPNSYEEYPAPEHQAPMISDMSTSYEEDNLLTTLGYHDEIMTKTSTEVSNPMVQPMSVNRMTSLENDEKIRVSILEGVLLATQHFSELGSFMFKLVSSFSNGFSKFARGLSHVFIGPIHEIESQFIGLSNSIVETLTTISNGTDPLFGRLNVNPISRIETFQQMRQSIMTLIEDRVPLGNPYFGAFATGLYPPVSELGIHENSTQTGGTSSSNETGSLYAQAIAANTQRMADTLELSNESLSILREKLGIAIVTEASKPDVTVNMVNNIYQVSDIDSVLSKLSAVVAREMDSKAEGVYL